MRHRADGVGRDATVSNATASGPGEEDAAPHRLDHLVGGSPREEVLEVEVDARDLELTHVEEQREVLQHVAHLRQVAHAPRRLARVLLELLQGSLATLVHLLGVVDLIRCNLVVVEVAQLQGHREILAGLHQEVGASQNHVPP